MRIAWSVFLLATAVAGAQPTGVGERAGDHYFETHIRPLLVDRCYMCHGERSSPPQGGLRLDSRAGLLRGGNGGPALAPGDPGNSRIVQFLRGTPGILMPPTGKLTEEQIKHVEAWIRMGAPFPEGSSSRPGPPKQTRHWAFVPPRAVAGPASTTDWARTVADGFIEARLHRVGLTHAKAASPRVLVRRIHFDLTGLPPDPKLIDGFEEAPTEQAYERIVDSLLASPHFGERWARHWLDVVRYSDEGFQARPFPIAWPYRDWVVQAFNDDLPFDEFVQLQIAADLTAGGEHDLEALGMLALGSNLPRPTDVPENVDDRIDVVTRGLLGLSVACARCHDHKFDPVPTEDYYSLYSIFLNSPSVLEPVPLESYGDDPETLFFLRKLASRRAWLDRFREERMAAHVGEFRKARTLTRYLQAGWEARRLGNREVESLSKNRNLNLYLLNRWRSYLNGLPASSVEAFRGLDSPGGAEAVARRMVEADSPYRWPEPEKEALRLALRGIGTPTDIPVEDFWWIQNEGDSNVMKGLKWQFDAVMHDWSYRGGPKHAMVVRDAPRPQVAFVFRRGNQHDKGKQVNPRFLSALSGAVQFRSGSGRLELAGAIATEDNPLVARVFVNRVWGHLFGEGIVRTPSDFGVRGDPPSHPQVLDHLATGFMADGWSLKNLIRRIVLSSTYRQSSLGSPAGAGLDPDNRLHWRQNRMRLDFEAMRDSMLFVAGRLDRGIGGPPFQLHAIPSSPRRTLYTYVSREEPSPLMRTFDFSNPEEHTPKRQLTTTPQQALFLINSPFAAEQSRSIAASCAESVDRVGCIHRRVLGRQPDDRAREEALAFLARAAEAADVDEDDPYRQPWLHGTGRLDPDTGAVLEFRPMRYRVGESLRPSPAIAARGVGRANLTARGGHPGDDMNSAVVRRWTAPRTTTVSITGKLNHPMSDQGKRFSHSNGIRGSLVSDRQGRLAMWTVAGSQVDTGLQELDVTDGERLDFVVDSFGDFESDAFQWSPIIVEAGRAGEPRSTTSPQRWTAEEGFSPLRESVLGPAAQYAQVLMMTNEFCIRE